MLLLSMSLISVTAMAEKKNTNPPKEIPSKEDQKKIKEAATGVADETKRLLRKIGRRSEDEACRFIKNDPKKCKQQKMEHQKKNEQE